MTPNALMEDAYTQIDICLHQLESGPLMNFRGIDPELENRSYYHVMNTIIESLKLVGRRHSTRFHTGMVFFLTMDGIKVLGAGGIREYLIDTDLAMQMHGRFPMVVTVSKQGLIFSKRLIQDDDQLSDLISNYQEDDPEYKERRSRRSTYSHYNRQADSALPIPENHTHFHTTVEGNVGGLYQDSIKQNSAPVIVESGTPTPPAKHHRLEIWYWIAGIAVAIVTVYLVFFRK